MTKQKALSRFNVVGSFLRPDELKEARLKHTEDEITADELRAIEDKWIVDLLKKQEKSGLKTATDGEFRRHFWHHDFFWSLNGVEHNYLDTGTDFSGTEARVDTARIVGEISGEVHPFVDDFKFVLKHVSEGIDPKQTIPAPAQFIQEALRPGNVDYTREVYATDEELIADVAAAYRTVIKDLYEAGARTIQFDAVVMNPPYSVKGWNRFDLTVSDPRFEVAGVLPPPSRGDFAFLLHGLFHLGQEGTMAIVLPHGVLFRGGAEGEIRQRLLEKNYIDTVIGMPSSLFTNTGIPVTVMILKKNRALNEPILMIDASKNFIKVGKQNVLEEKDIAKIVDTYTTRETIDGYSYNISREEIIENEYNLNIPRYVVQPDEEIPHDVDAHLYGGIPKENIENLHVLNEVAPTILRNALEEIRPNYYELNKEIDELTESVLNSEEMKEKATEMNERITNYINHYWPILKQVDNPAEVRPLMEEMLIEVKEILTNFKHLNVYDGYQLVAELWENYLTEDVEKISAGDFYELGRSREPNIVTKGSGKNKREEQDGWVGTLVPTDLIRKELYAEEAKLIEEIEAEIAEVESALDELVEAAQVEDSDENEILGESLNESKNSFIIGNIRKEIKNYEEDTEEYELIQEVLDLLSKRTKINRTRREKTQVLNEKVQNRILELSDEEINQLVYKKWFGNLVENMTRLIEEPLKEELETLEELNERYKDTLDDLDAEYKELEASFKEMANQLVVVEDE